MTQNSSRNSRKRRRRSLEEIGSFFGSDKFTVHGFADPYSTILGPRRDDRLKVLEIGIGGEDIDAGGASLFTWEEYFPNATIIGIDIYDKSSLNRDRIQTYVCDQGNPDELREMAQNCGPFDVIIDDGSHQACDVLISLFTLFPYVENNGIFVIEDIQASYWPKYGGTSIAAYFIETPISWIKTAIDCVNRSELLNQDDPAIRSGFKIDSLHVFHNIAFLIKKTHERKSSVLTPEIRSQWLKDDIAQFPIDPAILSRLGWDPQMRERLLDLLVAGVKIRP